MKRLWQVIVCILLINILPVATAYGDVNYELYSHGRFMELYEDIVEKVLNIGQSSFNEDKKATDIDNILTIYTKEKYDIEECIGYATSPNKEAAFRRSLQSFFINGFRDEINVLYYGKGEDLNKCVDDVKEVINRYQLDEELTVDYVIKVYSDEYVVENLDSKFYAIFKEHRSQTYCKVAVERLITKLDSIKDKKERCLAIDDFLGYKGLTKYIESKELEALIWKSRNSQNQIDQVTELILSKRYEKEYDRMFDKVTSGLLEIVNSLKCQSIDRDIKQYLMDNDIGLFIHGDISKPILDYQRLWKGYKERDEIVEEKLLSKLKYRYSIEEVNEMIDYIHNQLSEISMLAVSRKDIVTKCSHELYENYLDIVYDYRILDIKQYIVPEEILDVYLDYEELGYKSSYSALVNHMREILKKSRLDNDILKVIRESKYELEDIYEGVEESLDGDDEFKSFIVSEDMKKALKNKNDERILEVILDSIIESKKKEFIDFDKSMIGIVKFNVKNKEESISNYLESKGIRKNQIEVDKLVADGLKELKQGNDIRVLLIDNYFNRFIIGTKLSQDTIRVEINKLLDRMSDNSTEGIPLNYICERYIQINRLVGYINIQDIVNAFNNPIKSGYKDTGSGIKVIFEKGLKDRLQTELKDLKAMEKEEQEKIKLLKIVLKDNHINPCLDNKDLIKLYLK